VLAVALAFATVPFTVVPHVSAASACTALCGGGEFHALTPTRVFDSGATRKPIGPRHPYFDVQLLGMGGVPASASDVLAVAVNITVAAPSVGGTLATWPSGKTHAQPSVNFVATQTIASTQIVRPGYAGHLRIELNAPKAGTAGVLVEVTGWWSTSTYLGTSDARGLRTIQFSGPTRILDTRNGAAADTPIGAKTDKAITIRGAKAVGGTTVVVPNDLTNVKGAVVSITAWSATVKTHLSLQPTAIVPASPPPTYVLNVQPNRPVSNVAFVPLGADGAVHLYNAAGSVNVTVDVLGYLRAPGSETTRVGRVVPVATPFRVFDTRQPAFGKVPLGPGQAEAWSFAAFVNSVKIGTAWVGKQVGFIGTLTNASLARQYVTSPKATSSLTVYASSASKPGGISLATREGAATSATVVVRYGPSSTVKIYNADGYAHYFLDVSAVVLSD
jgi:hypothetical protein